jgi:transposase-like protein
MTPREININYGITGEITFTVTWHPGNINDGIAAINDFITRIDGVKAQPKAQQPKAKQNKRTRHLWTDDEKREAMRMYAEGVDMDIIVEKFQSTPLTVQKIMQKAGIRRPWPTKGNPSKVAEAEPEAEAVPVPSAEELEAEDRQRKADLREYRKQHPKPYYLN